MFSKSGLFGENIISKVINLINNVALIDGKIDHWDQHDIGKLEEALIYEHRGVSSPIQSIIKPLYLERLVREDRQKFYAKGVVDTLNDFQIAFFNTDSYKRLPMLENMLEMFSHLHLNQISEFANRQFLSLIAEAANSEPLSSVAKAHLRKILSNLPGFGMPEKPWEHVLLLQTARQLPIFYDGSFRVPVIQNYINEFIAMKTANISEANYFDTRLVGEAFSLQYEQNKEEAEKWIKHLIKNADTIIEEFKKDTSASNYLITFAHDLGSMLKSKNQKLAADNSSGEESDAEDAATEVMSNEIKELFRLRNNLTDARIEQLSSIREPLKSLRGALQFQTMIRFRTPQQ